MDKSFLRIGLCLLLISAPTLVLMAIEAGWGWYAFSRYEIRQVLSNKIDFHGHSIELRDTLDPREFTENDRIKSNVSILVDNDEYSTHSGVMIRPSYTDSNRYAGQMSLVILIDKKSGETKATVSQALPGGRVMILFIDSGGHVEREEFRVSERAWPVYRAMLMRFVHPVATGFFSGVLEAQPSLLYPIVYPFATGGVGLIIVAAAFGKVGMRRWKAER